MAGRGVEMAGLGEEDEGPYEHHYVGDQPAMYTAAMMRMQVSRIWECKRQQRGGRGGLWQPQGHQQRRRLRQLAGCDLVIYPALPKDISFFCWV